MKELFDFVTKLLPQPLLIAVVTTGCVYFSLYYHYSYHSYGDAFRDPKFRSAAVVIFAVCLFYMINVNSVRVKPDGTRPVVLVPQFLNDVDDTFRNPFISELESRLDRSLGRISTVIRIRTFVSDEKSARAILADYGASAILYDTSVNKIDNSQLLCLKVLTSSNLPTPCIPPFSFSDRAQHIEKIVVAVAGDIATTTDAESNPLVKRLLSMEERLNQLSVLIQAGRMSRFRNETFPEYPRRHAVIIGIDKVAGFERELRFSKSDAQELAELLNSKFGFQSKILLDENATKQAVLDAVQDVGGKANPDDLFVVYFCGNGSEIQLDGTPNGKIATIIPHDFNTKGPITAKELVEAISKTPARHKVAIVDACHATSGLESQSNSGPDDDPKQPVLHFFGACRGDQYSSENEQGGLFTRALIKSLSEESSRSKGGVWMKDLLSLVESKIDRTAFAQTPQLLSIDGDGEVAWTIPHATQ